MFRRFKLVVRVPSAEQAGKPSFRGQTKRTAGGGTDMKALVATALAHPPTWTNTLPIADPKGRAANTSMVYPLPLAGTPDLAKGGGTAWPISAAPR